ncbi:MAG: alpha-L-rhamnosidase [Pedobacter sp.]|nr:MAG: alpha-L-rhamnosidase [Pedobacter sp.]
MPKKSFLIQILVLFCFITPLAAQNKPHGLLTDLLSKTEITANNGRSGNIFSKYPYFSWIVPGTGQNTRQMAYHIVVSDDAKLLTQSKGNLWDSGKVKSNQSVAVAYKGAALKAGKTYYWRVKSYTNKSNTAEWSEVKAFTMGDNLSDYQASAEKLVKTKEFPVSIASLSNTLQLIDFGKDAFGQLTVQLQSESGKDTVKINLGEVTDKGRINPKPGGTIRYRSIKLALAKGLNTYKVNIEADRRNTGSAAIKMPAYIGEVLPFRYAEVDGYQNKLTKDDIFRDAVHYPFNEQNSYFKSSNDTLNQIWELCKYSIKATSFAGIYVDGDRERIPYEADAVINQLGHYGVDREYSMARVSSEYLLQKPTWPTEWILQALIFTWNDYLYTGDSRSLKANYEILKNRTLMQLKEKNGLISTTTGKQTPEFLKSINFHEKIRDIVDWPTSETDGFKFGTYNSVVNAYHYEALKLMENIAVVLGEKTDAQIYKAEHIRFKQIFNDAFLDKAKGIYRDGDSTEHASLHANMFAMDFGLVPATHVKSVMDFIQSRGMASSVYGSQFLLESLYDGAYADHALALLTSTDIRSWYNMIRVGSTISLEAWDNKFKPNQDWNHAWGAAPANIIPRRLMGVEPLKPGFETVSIKPQVASLSFAEAVIPTIRGAIKIAVKTGKTYELKVTLPANMDGEVYLPKLADNVVVTCNGKVVPAKLVDGMPFYNVGKIASGSYTFIMKGK